MNLRTYSHTLVMGALMLVASSVVGGSVLRVQAQDNNPFGHNDKASCESSGHIWDDAKGCADQYCLDGLFGYGDPGETQTLGGQIWMCDGFSGQWTQVMIVVQPVNPLRPLAPRPIGIAPVLQPTPSAPQLPVRAGGTTLQ